MDGPSAIVIGAGAAGLAATRLLTQAGLQVLLVEARNRIGGRIWSEHPRQSPTTVELGAEFVHGKPPEIWRWIEAGRLSAVEFEAENWTVRDGKAEQEREWPEFDELMDSMADAPEQSFRDFVEKRDISPELRESATAFVEGFNAASQDRISIQSLAQENAASAQIEGDRAFRLTGGYSSLVDFLWQGIDPARLRLRLGTVVESVGWARADVRVHARVGGVATDVSAPLAIVTVPIGVLQSRAIRFDPEPESLRAACSQIEMGQAVRMTLLFRRQVWRDRPELQRLGFLFSRQHWMPTWWTAHPAHSNCITGWTGGPRATSGGPPEEWLGRTLRSVGCLLGKSESALAEELEAWYVHDWQSDPYSQGAYSYVLVGGLPAQRRFGEPLEETLYFAGEAANDEGHYGTVHGAIASGERAARKILKLPLV